MDTTTRTSEMPAMRGKRWSEMMKLDSLGFQMQENAATSTSCMSLCTPKHAQATDLGD